MGDARRQSAIGCSRLATFASRLAEIEARHEKGDFPVEGGAAVDDVLAILKGPQPSAAASETSPASPGE